MEFCTMKRKELQSLCKRNGVPANLSNVEMATRLAALHKDQQQKKFKSCIRNLENVVGSDDENNRLKIKRGKKVKFNPENETFLFEKSDPRELRLLARKRRAMAKSESEKNPALFVENLRNVEGSVGNSGAIFGDVAGLEEPVRRNLRRKSVVKSNAGSDHANVANVMENVEKANSRRSLRSRGRKGDQKDVEMGILSPCVEKKVKRGRTCHEIVEEGPVERVDKPPSKMGTRRSLRRGGATVENLGKDDDGVAGVSKGNHLMKKDLDKKVENVVQVPRRSARHIEKTNTKELTLVSKKKAKCISIDRDDANGFTGSSVEIAPDCRKRKRAMQKVASEAIDQQNANAEKPVDDNAFIDRTLQGRKVVTECLGEGDTKVSVDECLKRKNLRGKTKKAEKDGDFATGFSGRRVTRRTEKLKVDALLKEQVADDNIPQSSDYINQEDNQGAQLVNKIVETSSSIQEKLNVVMTDDASNDQAILGGQDSGISKKSKEVDDASEPVCRNTAKAMTPERWKVLDTDCELSSCSLVIGDRMIGDEKIASNKRNRNFDLRKTEELPQLIHGLVESGGANESIESENAINTEMLDHATVIVDKVDGQVMEEEDAAGSMGIRERVSKETDSSAPKILDYQLVSQEKVLADVDVNVELNAHHPDIKDGSALLAEASIVSICGLKKENEDTIMLIPLHEEELGTHSRNPKEAGRLDESQNTSGSESKSESSTLNRTLQLQSQIDGELIIVLDLPKKGEESCRKPLSDLVCLENIGKCDYLVENDELIAAKRLDEVEDFADATVLHQVAGDAATDSYRSKELELEKSPVVSSKDTDRKELSECKSAMYGKINCIERNFEETAQGLEADNFFCGHEGAKFAKVEHRKSLQASYPGTKRSSSDIKSVRNEVPEHTSITKGIIFADMTENSVSDDEKADISSKSCNYSYKLMEEEVQKVSQVPNMSSPMALEERKHSLQADQCNGLESSLENVDALPCKSGIIDEAVSNVCAHNMDNLSENTGQMKQAEVACLRPTGSEGLCSSPFSVFNQQADYVGVKVNYGSGQVKAKSPAALKSQSFGYNEKLADAIEEPIRDATDVKCLPLLDDCVRMKTVDVAPRKINHGEVNSLKDAPIIRSDDLAHESPENQQSSLCLAAAEVSDASVGSGILNSAGVEVGGNSEMGRQNIDELFFGHVQYMNEAASLIANMHLVSERPEDLQCSTCQVDGMHFDPCPVEHGENQSMASDADTEELEAEETVHFEEQSGDEHDSNAEKIDALSCKSVRADETTLGASIKDMYDKPGDTFREKFEATTISEMGCHVPCCSPSSNIDGERDYEHAKRNFIADQTEAKDIACLSAVESLSFGGDERAVDEIDGGLQEASKVGCSRLSDDSFEISEHSVAKNENKLGEMNTAEEACMTRSDDLAFEGHEDLRISSYGIAEVPDVGIDLAKMFNPEESEANGDQGNSRTEKGDMNGPHDCHIQEDASAAASDQESERCEDSRCSPSGVDRIQYAQQIDHEQNGSQATIEDLQLCESIADKDHRDAEGDELDYDLEKLDELPCKSTIVDEKACPNFMNHIHDTPDNSSAKELVKAANISEMESQVLCHTSLSDISCEREANNGSTALNCDADQAVTKNVLYPAMVEPQSFVDHEKATEKIGGALLDTSDVRVLPLIDDSAGTSQLVQTESQQSEANCLQDPCMHRSGNLISEMLEDLERSACEIADVSDVSHHGKSSNPEKAVSCGDQGYNVDLEKRGAASLPMSPVIDFRNSEAVPNMHDKPENSNEWNLFGVSGRKEMAREALSTAACSSPHQQIIDKHLKAKSEQALESPKEDTTSVGLDKHSFFTMSDDGCLHMVDNSAIENDQVVSSKEGEHEKVVDTVEFGEVCQITLEQISDPCENGSNRSLDVMDIKDNSSTKPSAFSIRPCAFETVTSPLKEQNHSPSNYARQQPDSTDLAVSGASADITTFNECGDLNCNVESCIFSNWEIDLMWGEMTKDDNSSNTQIPTNEPIISRKQEAVEEFEDGTIHEVADKPALNQETTSAEKQFTEQKTVLNPSTENPDFRSANKNQVGKVDERPNLSRIANRFDENVENVKDLPANDRSDKMTRSLMIKRKDNRSILIHGTPRKQPHLIHDMKENTTAPKARQMVDVTAVKPPLRRKVLKDLKK